MQCLLKKSERCCENKLKAGLDLRLNGLRTTEKENANVTSGQELIEEIAECSSYIEQHPMGANVQRAMERRRLLRRKLEELPDLSFS